MAEDQYICGATIIVTVTDTSAGFTAEQLKPTSGALQGYTMEKALIQAIGALYMEAGGAAATTSSYPMAATDAVSLSGYINLSRVQFIKNTTDTTMRAIPMYR